MDEMTSPEHDLKTSVEVTDTASECNLRTADQLFQDSHIAALFARCVKELSDGWDGEVEATYDGASGSMSITLRGANGSAPTQATENEVPDPSSRLERLRRFAEGAELVVGIFNTGLPLASSLATLRARRRALRMKRNGQAAQLKK
jgi:hypothetical protein